MVKLENIQFCFDVIAAKGLQTTGLAPNDFLDSTGGKEELRLEEEKLVLSFLWNMMRKIERIGRINQGTKSCPQPG